VRLTTLPGSISFRGLTFAYPSRRENIILDNLSLSIPLHSSIAIVGPSGSGKSTIAALLMGLYPSPGSSRDATADGLWIGPLPFSSLHLPTYRSLVAFVPQSTVLFPGTIAANITYGLPFHSPYQHPTHVRNAARLAGLDAFISSLPSGYATPVGDGGIGLSGGQVQRLGIARALVRDPELLIMDEPTASLDNESARAIREALAGLVRCGKTAMVITHSWEMMRAMGRVVVLGRGRVVEDGRWADLMGREDSELRSLLGGGAGLDVEGCECAV
jgi:ATP-binding cassette, subfamily B (MDR/TAP), member 1